MRSGPIWAAVAAALLCSCVKPPATPEPLALESVRFDQIPGWSADKQAESIGGLRAECRRLALLPPDTVLGGQGLTEAYGGKPGQWASVCAAAWTLAANDAAAIRQFYETRFQPYRVQGTGVVTGYYEPEVAGALSRGRGFTVPVLARPADLVQVPADTSDPGAPPLVGRRVGGKLIPYWTRAEIESGAMGAAARPLLWLRDPADLFFLQVQGAGRVRLPDGSVVRVGYDGKNGRAYTPIGGVLLAEKALQPTDVSMQTIKAWLVSHPVQAKAVMDRNDDYVFFRLLQISDSALGPPGALGVDLTPWRSAAVDPRYVPMGLPVFLDTTEPVSGAAWRHLLLAQDSGTDVRGAGRIDIFFGVGALAEQVAGRMHQPGVLYVLLPRPTR